MGNSSNSDKKIQVLILGLEQTGKSTLLKRIVDAARATREEFQIETTNGFNYVNRTLSNGNVFNIWDLGGDKVNKDFWPIFYRTLNVKLVIYVIELTEQETILTSLQDLVILMNEESLKEANFYIIFNCIMPKTQDFKESDFKKKVELIISRIKEYPIFRFNERLRYLIIDIKKSTFSDSQIDSILNFAIEESNNKSY
jgi:small GTP-binding protein